MRRLFFFAIAFASALFFLGCNQDNKSKRISIIPLPAHMEVSKGNFSINANTSIVFRDSSLVRAANHAKTLWVNYLNHPLPLKLVDQTDMTNSISLIINNNFDEEIGSDGYVLNINQRGITLLANTATGIQYGIQTIYQLLGTNPNGKLPCLNIIDYPRFGYRGMHLDVARHFMPIEFIFKMIDRLEMHKMNVFHWHLIDDQGWRLEIKKYPKLTEVGAWRVDKEDLHWNNRPLINDPENATYGGYYTQDQVKAVVAYAAERNITVIPEIEMPAHVMSALAAYPEYSCTGENLGVPPGGVWPITHIYCAGNDETFKFLENILTEVMELFPSKYIHIGGDEAEKDNWKICKKCQNRIKKEGLKDEQELQSYFTKRIEKFLNDNGRTLIGWDEILEGGLAPNAVVMSWRGEEGGIEAAKHGNHVIMTPGSHCYFDHYQGDPSVEPLAIGGNTTLKKVYHYEPVPSVLTPDQAKLVLGAQANVWTEYMPIPEQVEYMVFPRLAALSEVLWSPKGTRNWENFLLRMEDQYKRYQKLGINFSRSAYQVIVTPNLDPEKKILILNLESETDNSQIRYTLDGSEPNTKSTIYKNPIEIDKTTLLKAASFKDGIRVGEVRISNYLLHKAFACSVDLKFPNRPNYDGEGEYGLVNGISGSISFKDVRWKGFLGVDLIATIDLGETKRIEKISVDALQDNVSWIFLPKRATFEVSSDGVQFTVIETIENSISPFEGGKIIQLFTANMQIDDIRFVRVHLQNLGVCPEGHLGQGNPAFLFVSEIVVE